MTCKQKKVRNWFTQCEDMTYMCIFATSHMHKQKPSCVFLCLYKVVCINNPCLALAKSKKPMGLLTTVRA